MSKFTSALPIISEAADIQEIFKSQRHVTDIYLSTGKVPYIRKLNQTLALHEYAEISPGNISALITSLSANRGEQMIEQGKGKQSDNFAYETGIEGRLRINVSLLLDGKNKLITIRRIPEEIPDPTELKLPPALVSLVLKDPHPSGLILIGGETGNGKSTTLASLLQQVNENVYGHIVTIENPIEFMLIDDKCLCSQRELGTAVTTWAEGAQDTLRQKADYVMVGEIQDKATALAVLRATESGHTVFATLHTSSGVKMIERMLSFFDQSEQPQIRNSLSNNLLMLVGQKLVPNLVGGLTLACEVLPGSSAIRAAIRDNQESEKLRNALLSGGDKEGAQPLETALFQLVEDGIISENTALAYANDPETLKQKMNTPKSGIGGRR